MIASTFVNALVSLHAAGVGCNAAATPPTASRDMSWHKYIRSPESLTVKPKSILPANTTGDISNPDGLLDGYKSPTVLTRKDDSDEVPSVIVDFGQNVVGIVSIAFAGSTNSSIGFPGLKLAFSETQQYLTNVSDFTRSDNMPAVGYKTSLLFSD